MKPPAPSPWHRKRQRARQEQQAALDAAQKLVEQIRPILAGQRPEVIGAALMQLTATFFAGHHPEIREETIKWWFAATRALIPAEEAELFAKHGTTNPWSPQ